MQPYIWSVVLFAPESGELMNEYSIIQARTENDAAVFGLRLCQKRNPKYRQIVAFNARPLSDFDLTLTIADVEEQKQ